MTGRSWSGSPPVCACREEIPECAGRFDWRRVAMSSCSVSKTLEAMGRRGFRTIRFDLCLEPEGRGGCLSFTLSS